MPRGNPKKPTALRLDPSLVAQVLARTTNLTAAIEDGLRLWIAWQDQLMTKARRKPTKNKASVREPSA